MAEPATAFIAPCLPAGQGGAQILRL